MDTPIFASYAPEYRAKGWAPFPVTPGSKIGFPAGVTGYEGTVTDEKIAGWITNRPNDNIGLRMEGVLGFDLDEYFGKHGATDYWSAVGRLEGEELPKTYSMTSRGPKQESRTYFFRVPEGDQFITKVSENIEILQYHHRYAIAFPSIHPKTQQPYQWYDPDGNACGIPSVEDLAPLEGAWYDYLLKRKTRVKYASQGGYRMDDVDLDAWTATLSEGEVTQTLRDRLGPEADGWEDGRYESIHAAVWAFGKLSVLSPELEGLRALWDEILEARVTSTTSETPQNQRVEDIIRSIKGAIAKWSAYLEENPPLDPVLLEWAKNRTPVVKPKEESVSTPTPPTQNPPTLPVSTPAPSGAQSLLDIPLAHWLENRIRDLVCYTGAHGWLFFEDGYWKVVTQERITRLVMDELSILRDTESRATNDPKRLGELVQLARLNKVNTVRDAVKALVEKDPLIFDKHPDHINTPKGILHLPTLETLPHDPKFYFTKITKGSYIPGYTHPDFEMAKNSLPTDSVNWLQWKLGQSITGYPASDDKVCFLKGTGENGKSGIVTPLMASLGGFATMVPDGVLLSNKNSSSAGDMATLLGVRVAVMEELPESRFLDTKKLKEVAGTEMMTGRFLYKNPITWAPTHALIVTTNYTPQVYETDWGVWRRMSLVIFPYRFRKPGQPLEYANDRQGDPLMRQRLKDGFDGQHDAVFTWLAIGAHAWYGNNKVIPEAGGKIDADTNQWRMDSDQTLAYINDYMEFDPTSCVAVDDVVKHFNWHFKQQGSQQVSAKTLIPRFMEHEQVKSAGVESARPSKPTNLTRPVEDSSYGGYTASVLPQRPTVWTGLKYKEAPPLSTPWNGNSWNS